jgi:hypothetical protein
MRLVTLCFADGLKVRHEIPLADTDTAAIEKALNAQAAWAVPLDAVRWNTAVMREAGRLARMAVAFEVCQVQ